MTQEATEWHVTEAPATARRMPVTWETQDSAPEAMAAEKIIEISHGEDGTSLRIEDTTTGELIALGMALLLCVSIVFVVHQLKNKK